jgi:hypothetical protein
MRITLPLGPALSRLPLSGDESRCLWAIITETYGAYDETRMQWGKKHAPISPARFRELTEIKGKKNIPRALKNLEERNIIFVIRDGKQWEYGVQKDYERWIMERSRKGEKAEGIHMDTDEGIQMDTDGIQMDTFGIQMDTFQARTCNDLKRENLKACTCPDDGIQMDTSHRPIDQFLKQDLCNYFKQLMKTKCGTSAGFNAPAAFALFDEALQDDTPETVKRVIDKYFSQSHSIYSVPFFSNAYASLKGQLEGSVQSADNRPSKRSYTPGSKVRRKPRT